MVKRSVVGIVAAVLFVVGAAYIVYQGRPVMESARAGADEFTLADVQTHNSAASCWAAISGNVYDLTDWVNQHPGGPERILSLCGTDGTAAFTTQHEGAERPASMLLLFKIGSLQTP